MKKIVLAALLLIAAFGSKAQTLPLDLAAYRALLAGPSHFGCTLPLCRTKTIQAAEADSLYGFLLRMAALSASLGDLHTVLGLGNVSSIPVRIENTTFAFYSLLNHYGITTTHNPPGFPDEYPVTYLGWSSGEPVLMIRDAFGYFGQIKAGNLTALRKIRIPDEGDGLDWKSDAVIHETGTPTHVNQYPYGRTETGGGYTIWKDTTTGKIAKITTYSGTPALSLQDASSSYYSVIQSGSISDTVILLTPNTPGYIATRRDTIGDGVSDMPKLVTQHYLSTISAGSNFATADLTLTGDREHNIKRYNIGFDSTLSWKIADTNGRYLFNLNSFSDYATSLFYLSSRSDQTVRISPNTSFQSRLLLVNQAAGNNTVELFGGNNKITMTQAAGVCFTSIAAGGSNPATCIIDSTTRAVGVNHLTGTYLISSVAAGTGAGTGPTITMGSGSTDLNGYINVTTGTTCAADATVATVTFGLPYRTAPKTVILSPANKEARNLTNGQQVFVNQADITTTTFVLKSNSVVLVDATAYQWYYTVIQ